MKGRKKRKHSTGNEIVNKGQFCGQRVKGLLDQSMATQWDVGTVERGTRFTRKIVQ